MAKYNGTGRNDTLIGDSTDDELYGRRGDDDLRGGAGNDYLDAGTGNDYLDGGSGSDILVGGAGDDTYIVDSSSDVIIEQAGEGNDTVQASASYTLSDNIERLELTGSDDIDAIGNALNNVLLGNSGNNILDGQAGTDIMAGGAGDDTYRVDNTGDLIFEFADQGIDTVEASISHTLAGGLENLTLTGDAHINGTGNTLDNTLTGNSGDNILSGGVGQDTGIYQGNRFDYTITQTTEGYQITDSAAGRDGSDTLYGLESLKFADLTMNLGTNNALVGSVTVEGDPVRGATLTASADLFDADGVGTLTYQWESSTDGTTWTGVTGATASTYTLTDSDPGSYFRAIVSYTDGFGTQESVTSGPTEIIAHQLGTDADDHLIGTAGDDILNGLGGNDTLDGQAGADTLLGGTGDDTFIVDNAGDVVVEYAGEGTDTVKTGLKSYTLDANVENLETTGYYATLTGNELDNKLTSLNTYSYSADILDGGTGADTMSGGNGSDIYYVDNAGDVIVEGSGYYSGTDTVNASVDYTLGDNLENLNLTASGITGTGNALNNTYTLFDSTNRIIEAADGGIDTVNTGVDYTLDANVENAVLTAGGITVTGNELNNHYTVNNSTSVIAEGENGGIDTIRTNQNAYSLDANVENLETTGYYATLTGNELDNKLTSLNTYSYSADILDGGTGADTMSGGNGSDTYYVDNAGDVIVEGSGYYSGTDTVNASVDYTLGDNLENLNLTASGITGTGNALNNTYTLFDSTNRIIEAADGGIDTVNTGVDYTLDANVENAVLTAGGITVTGNELNNHYTVNNSTSVIAEGENGGIDTIRTNQNAYSLDANVENLETTGYYATLTGNELDNKLTSLNTYSYSADILDGGTGADTMSGGNGSDTYYVDNAGDVIVEGSGYYSGTDTVNASVDYTLGDNLENLNLTASGITGTGNALNNTYTLFDSTNRIIEAADGGIDTVNTGVDYTLDANVENAVLTAGGITVTGNELNNHYTVNNSTSVIAEGENGGIDTIRTNQNAYSLDANVENLETTGYYATLTGNELDNKLTSLNTYSYSADILDGGTGADTMSGGNGSDTYYVDNAGDVIVEGSGYYSGTDTVNASVDYTLGDNLENLNLTASGITGTGNALNNTYTLFDSTNRIIEAADGGIDTVNTGVDYTLDANVENAVLTAGGITVTGNELNNHYTVNNSTSVIAEGENGGIDTIRTNQNAYSLDANVENLETTGYYATLTGNELDNKLTSLNTYSYSADILDGGTGADTMSGGNGSDTYYVDNAGDVIVEGSGYYSGTDTVIASVGCTLTDNVENLTLTGSDNLAATGNAGDNVLTGNAGSNLLTGGAGNDTFHFDDALDAATNLDTITDFTTGSDHIQLENGIFTALSTTGDLSADHFIGGEGLTAAADANDHVIYNSTTGALYYDPDGSGADAAVQFASLSAGLALSSGDFMVA